MKLTRVYVDNYRNLKNCSIRLSDPDILVGENNVGKTNLLNAIGKILTSEGRVYFTDEDFADPGKPIVIELTFSNFSNVEDEAIFYDQEGTKNPETNEVKVRLKAEWNERERDIAVVLTFVREDLPEEEQEIREFSWSFRRYIPYYYIPSYREIEREITSRRGDLFGILQSFTPYQTVPILTLRRRLAEALGRLSVELEEDTYGEEITYVRESQQKIESSEEIREEDTNAIVSTLLEIQEKIKADDELEEKELLNITIAKIHKLAVLLGNRTRLQEELQTLKENVRHVSEIDNLEHEVNEILALFLDREKIHLDMVPVKDEDLIQRIGIDVGDYSVLKHGSGYQSLLVLVLKLFKALYMVIKREEVDFRSFIVAIEEPESHLHPHLQRHLIRALMEIQKKFRADDIELQLIISTHSPHTLVTISPENLTLLRSTTESSSPNGLKLIKEEFIEEVSSITPVDAATLRKRKKQLSRWLSQFFNTYAEVFFSRCVIVGEGDTEQGAIPVFSEKIIGDLDKYGVSFLNGEGDKLTYPIKLLSKLKIPWVLIIDKDKKETIKSLPEYKEEVVFCTDEIAFEAEIISKVPLPKILEVIDIIAIPERNDERIKHVKGYFTELKGATIASITEILNYLEQENVNKFKQEFVLKWLRDEKGLALGKNLAELTDKEEIPQAFVKAVEKAAEISEALEL